jgi:magnesium chelatase family protein
MRILAFAHFGYEGELVTVEIDIRRGIPGVSVIGLPDGAVREATERVRAAIRNSGYEFPANRVLINLAPASLRKEGSAFDLPIALAILLESGQAHCTLSEDVMISGELELSGRVRAVPALLQAVCRAAGSGLSRFIVPETCVAESSASGCGRVFGVGSLNECVELLNESRFLETDGEQRAETSHRLALGNNSQSEEDWRKRARASFYALSWPARLERAALVAAAGSHHLLLAGPPGGGKTMLARRLVSLLPDLPRAEALEASRIHSLAGLSLGELSPEGSGILTRPPFRTPHHSASAEGMVGGGRVLRPGEISLAHRGILVLDEAPEFNRDILQALREPLEEGSVTISRAGRQARFPARFQLVMTANPCPCGNLGKRNAACVCSLKEVEQYWRRFGGALLDRVDLRVPVLARGEAPDSASAREKVAQSEAARIEATLDALWRAFQVQEKRYAKLSVRRNAHLRPEDVERFCRLTAGAARLFDELREKQGLSSRGAQSALKVARSLADLDGEANIMERQVEEAVAFRAFGDSDWERYFV